MKRKDLRSQLYFERGRRSDLSRRPLSGGFDMHEALITRAFVRKDQSRLFHPCNVLLLRREEHIPHPPPPMYAYWLLCALNTREAVEAWLDGLGIRSSINRTWNLVNGEETVLEHIPFWYQQLYQEKIPDAYFHYYLPRLDRLQL